MIILRQKTYTVGEYSYDSNPGHFKRNQDKYLIGGGL